MKTNAINEFKLWSICLIIGIAILATEVVVKAMRPSSVSDDLLLPLKQLLEKDQHSSHRNALPEEIVADLLVESVIQVESGGRPRTVGSKGERGLMQIMESTWCDVTRTHFGSQVNFQRAFEPDLNREVGTAYLSHLHEFLQANRDKWQADERSLLLACYNAGPQRVAKSGFNLRRLPRSTQDYVARASALHDAFLKDNAMKLESRMTGRGDMQIVQLHPALDS